MIRLIGLLGAKGAGKDTAAKFLVERMHFVRASFAEALYNEVAAAYGVSVAFLENRETKETPLPELKLERCRDSHFVEIAMQQLTFKTCKAAVPGWAPTWGRGLFWVLGAVWAMLRFPYEMRAPRSPRWVLQLWGTEYRRRSAYGHDSYWLDQVAALTTANPDSNFVITDVRFTNEADWVETQGGVLMRVRRPELEAKEAAARAAGTMTALHLSETELLSRKVGYELINREGAPESLADGLQQALAEFSQAA